VVVRPFWAFCYFWQAWALLSLHTVQLEIDLEDGLDAPVVRK
jgi:hypothetical protein